MTPSTGASLPVLGQRAPAPGDPRPQADAPDERPDYPVPPELRTGRLWRALEEVMDPEIPVSLVDLGLIYEVREEGEGAVTVDLTFTATACPCMAFIRFDIEERLLREEGVREVRIREVWNPPWTKSRITPRGREQMKALGVSM